MPGCTPFEVKIDKVDGGYRATTNTPKCNCDSIIFNYNAIASLVTIDGHAAASPAVFDEGTYDRVLWKSVNPENLKYALVLIIGGDYSGAISGDEEGNKTIYHGFETSTAHGYESTSNSWILLRGYDYWNELYDFRSFVQRGPQAYVLYYTDNAEEHLSFSKQLTVTLSSFKALGTYNHGGLSAQNGCFYDFDLEEDVDFVFENGLLISSSPNHKASVILKDPKDPDKNIKYKWLDGNGSVIKEEWGTYTQKPQGATYKDFHVNESVVLAEECPYSIENVVLGSDNRSISFDYHISKGYKVIATCNDCISEAATTNPESEVLFQLSYAKGNGTYKIGDVNATAQNGSIHVALVLGEPISGDVLRIEAFSNDQDRDGCYVFSEVSILNKPKGTTLESRLAPKVVIIMPTPTPVNRGISAKTRAAVALGKAITGIFEKLDDIYDSEFDSFYPIPSFSPIPTPSITKDYDIVPPCVYPPPPPTQTKTPTVTSSITPTETRTPTVTRSAAKSLSVTKTQTKTPTISITQSITPTESLTPSETPTQTITPSETVTPTNTTTGSITPTQSITPTETITPSETVTPSETMTPTPSISSDTPPSVTPTETPTVTPTETVTPSETVTPTATVSQSITPSETPVESVTPTNTPTKTKSQTPPTPSPTKSKSITQTITKSKSITQTLPTPSPTKSHTPTPTKSQTPPTPSETKSLTPTPAPPTVTKSKTITPTPVPPTVTKTKTPTKTKSSTPVPVSVTPTPTCFCFNYTLVCDNASGAGTSGYTCDGSFWSHVFAFNEELIICLQEDSISNTADFTIMKGAQCGQCGDNPS